MNSVVPVATLSAFVVTATALCAAWAGHQVAAREGGRRAVWLERITRGTVVLFVIWSAIMITSWLQIGLCAGKVRQLHGSLAADIVRACGPPAVSSSTGLVYRSSFGVLGTASEVHVVLIGGKALASYIDD